MAQDLDFQESSCRHNPNFLFDDVGISVSHFWHNEENHIHNHEATTENGSRTLTGFLLLSEERVREMIVRETEYLPNDDYVNNLRSGNLVFSVRGEAVDWIYKAYPKHRFGASSVCLSVNYLDRFLSTSSLPNKAWLARMLAVACLSLAVKMEEDKLQLLVDFQVGEDEYLFEAKSIRRMEMMVLSKLQWRLHAITPFSFIDYFLSKITTNHHNILSTSKSIQLILNTVKGIELMEFRHSEVAAALAICISEGGTPPHNTDDEIASKLDQVDKVRVLKCVEVIRRKDDE